MEKDIPEEQAADTEKPSRVLKYVYTGLFVLVLVFVLIFLISLVWSIFFRKDNPEASISTVTEAPPSSAAENIFSNIGRQRLVTADSKTVILTVSFPYSAEDKAFTEELVSRIPGFRSLAVEYFLRMSADEIRAIDEERIKENLLEEFNSILRLGKIEILYFTDYLIID